MKYQPKIYPEGLKCAVHECDRDREKRDWCEKHYRRWVTHGDPCGGQTFMGSTQEFLEKHKSYDGNDCLIWPLGRGDDGYGRCVFNGKRYRAHRAMCEMVHGAPPTPKHEAAHSCGMGHIACVNPRHLRWATRKENEADKIIHRKKSS